MFAVRKSVKLLRFCRFNSTLVTETDGIREIQMIDGKTRNSLSMKMMAELQENIQRDENNKDLRVIVLSAAPGPVFSSGHNLKELSSDKDYDLKKRVFTGANDLISAIRNSPIPIICKINGLASAAGCQLAASCDIVICTDTSKFSTPGASFGIFCSTPGIAIARVMPRMMASYMVLTGLPITADEALKSGLVAKVVSSSELDSEVLKICDAIKSKSRPVIALGKKFFNTQIGLNIEEAYEKGAKTMADNLELRDGKEGINSFIEKRKPKWTHQE